MVLQKTTEKPMQVLIYIRVSTKEQVEGYSLDYQEKICREYCERQSWDVIKVFREQGESAKTADRTELLNLLKFCHENKGKVDILLVHKLDRFSRNTTDHTAVRAALLKVGVKLRSVSESIDDSPAGKLMENIFSSIAQFDNDVRSERTKAGMLEKLRQGHWPWKAPLGYKNTPTGLVVDKERSELITGAFETYIRGGYNFAQLTKLVNLRGLRTEKNKKITPQYLLKIIKNKLYMGVVSAWGEEHPAMHEAIITKDTFYKAEAIRLGKSSQINIPHMSKNPTFPIKNIAKCGECDKYLTGSWSKGRSKKYPYYHCVCGGTRVKKELLENNFYELIKTIQPNQELKELFKVLLVKIWEKKNSENIIALQKIDNEINKIRELKKKLIQKNIEGVISDKDYKEISKAYDEQLLIKEVERSDYRSSESNLDHMIALVESIFTDISSLWFEASFENKQRFQALVFPNGLPVMKDGFGTAILGLPFNLISDFAGDETTLVTPREVESRFSG